MKTNLQIFKKIKTLEKKAQRYGVYSPMIYSKFDVYKIMKETLEWVIK